MERVENELMNQGRGENTGREMKTRWEWTGRNERFCRARRRSRRTCGSPASVRCNSCQFQKWSISDD